MIRFLLIISLALPTLTGCQASETPAPASSPVTATELSSDEAPMEATLIQGNPSGLWYMLTTAISESLSDTYPGSILNITPGSSGPNILRLDASEADFAMLHSNLTYEAIYGLGGYEETHEHIRGIASFYPSYVQFVLKEKFNITSFAQFIEEKPSVRISIGSQGSSTADAFLRVLGAYDLTVEDLESWGCTIEYKGQADMSKMFSDGVLDGFFIIAAAQNPIIIENIVNTPMNFVVIEEPIIKELAEEYGYALGTITQDNYDFLSQDLLTLTTYSMLGASDQTPVDKAYKMAKTLHENLDYLTSIHVSLADLNPEILIDTHGIPLHPGAEMYYREIGLID